MTKRIGDQRKTGRPLLIVLDTEKRKQILDNASKVVQIEGLENTRIKKDKHPAIRREWGRLWKMEEEEKQKPENIGYEIKFDVKKRKL